MAESKKKDYSSTAVNLCNPEEVKEALDNLHESQRRLRALEDQRRMENPGLDQEINLAAADVSNWKSDLEILINKHGSYQDVEKGEYALQYVARTKQYNAKSFIARYPEFVPAVIVEAINVDALEGLIKGGLLTLESLEAKRESGKNNDELSPVITYKEQKRTVIE